MVSMLDRARVIAEDVLFPAALTVDADEVIPVGHFARLAEEGFYGLAGRAEDGGAETAFASFVRIVEILSGGCLTTTFTWLQHHSVVRGLTTTPNTTLREKYLDAAIRGELRGGVAFAGAIPRPPLLWASRTDGGWLVRGESPFVTGWDIIDVLLISARDVAGGLEGTIVSGLVPAVAGGGITAEQLRLIAAQGSNTVRLRFEDFFLPTDRVVAEVSHTDFLAHQLRSARLNGSLALGVGDRCIRLIGQADQPELAYRLGARLRASRDRLDAAIPDPDALPAARAAASALAHQAAGALVAAVGSSGILAHRHAQRLVREAAFTLVAASRPEIKNELLDLFGR
ncbi:MAG TPA: acyl-CoA dehydrogenase family protein [Pseudonocardiaceae bacterium]|nr:acyl-CoA dehydrogenase family protein [Pseudonocardiaceae bacterium]